MITSSLPGVNLSHCIYREECSEAASSYIIRSQETSSRTIVNYNELKEMSFEEFKRLGESLELGEGDGDGKGDWWHFEVCTSWAFSFFANPQMTVPFLFQAKMYPR
jgi:ketohexokinase